MKPSDYQEPQTDRQLTFGEKLVGITFNPSNDNDVHKAKQLCALLADLAHEEYLEQTLSGRVPPSPLAEKLFNHTIGEILNAQMNVVKFLTFKY